MLTRIIYGWQLNLYIDGVQWILKNPKTDEQKYFSTDFDACKYAAGHKLSKN